MCFYHQHFINMKESGYNTISPQATEENSPAEQLNFMQSVVDGIEAIILVVDLNKPRLVWANDGYKRLIGFDGLRDVDFEMEQLTSRYHPQDISYLENMKDYLMKNPEDTYTAFYRFRHADGHYLWLFTSTRVFRIDRGKNIFETVSVSVDFTGPISYRKNLKQFSQNKLQWVNQSRINKITKREKEILRHFAAGGTTTEVSELLGLSPHTVNNHRKNMLKKLGLKNLAALVNFAVENGLD